MLVVKIIVSNGFPMTTLKKCQLLSQKLNYMVGNQEKPHLYDFTISKAYSLHRSCYHNSWPYYSMFVIKVGTFFLNWSWGTNWTLLYLQLTPISGSYSSDFAYRLYPSLIVKKFKIKFSQKELERFF